MPVPMRPADLNPLFVEATKLRGVGPKVAAALDRLLGGPSRPARVLDLVLHLPVSIVDRSTRAKIRDAPRDQVVTLVGRVREHLAPANARAPFRAVIEDETGDCTLVFFRNNASWVEKALPLGTTRFVSGRLELWDGRLQMVHPDRVLDEAGFASMPLVEPVYPLTEGLFPRVLGKAIEAALDRVPQLPEWQDEPRRLLRGWPSFDEALRAVHRPKSARDVGAETPARLRLAYDELLASQLALALVRGRAAREAGVPHVATGALSSRIEAALPFALTGGQRRALEEIRADMASPRRMLRLLQGDVGSGKTVVALLAAASAVEAGTQAALMAPTEILARQHAARIAPLAAAAGMRVAVLTGRDRASERAATQAGLAEGTIDLVVGTHALFSEGVAFKDLGLVIVDEQHRFGVAQRLTLAEKGRAAELLVMTATPIPRTLVLTIFGDMDVSVLREKPAGRQPIQTIKKTADAMEEVVAAVGRAVAGGARVYWVCPLVTESEHADLVAAEDRFRALEEVFGARVRLIHGQMKAAERDAAMADFAAGRASVLVATTVIEVGVDVPEASVMVIEHAERFGLAQLHQLRGRVGRGAARSFCVLVYKAPLGKTAEARIDMMRDTEDGFAIAEADLRLRGEGELIGTKQSGLPDFKLALLDVHQGLLEEAREEAAGLVAADPTLSGPRGPALRALLHLFERDAAARLLQGG